MGVGRHAGSIKERQCQPLYQTRRRASTAAEIGGRRTPRAGQVRQAAAAASLRYDETTSAVGARDDALLARAAC